ncbi:hypothetical protein [Bifidobacterium samirii]|uniref:hypothetical protein n=1 Tax=Bifidobacterium samirii TaxID=2306974 RepID=UPI0013E0E323|nr:hypothetical protein [Bifidobacterium samirii]
MEVLDRDGAAFLALRMLMGLPLLLFSTHALYIYSVVLPARPSTAAAEARFDPRAFAM